MRTRSMPLQGFRPPQLVILLLVASTLQSCLADKAECGGHGHKSNGNCVCDDQIPGEGATGWAGENCTIPIHGALLDGSDMTAGCQSQNCSSLQPDEWMCYSSFITWNDANSPWNFLTVQLTRTSDDSMGDPDLYGLFFGGSSGAGKVPDTGTYQYDFRETSSSSHRSVVKKIAKKDFAEKDYAGVYLCVKAYGDVPLTYALRATLSKCPGDFTDAGEAMECSSLVSAADKRSSGCNDDGTCQCKAPYEKPLASTYSELGFEDCSARVTNVTDDHFSSGSFIAEHEVIAAKAWNFYSFNVTDQDYQVVVNVAGERDSGDECSDYGYFSAFVKYNQPPGWRYGQYDFRPSWDYYSEDDSDLEIAFDQTQEGFQRGVWYVGVNGDDLNACKYTLTISKYTCPMNCSGRGECIFNGNGTRVCQCSPGYLGADCSQETAALQFGTPVTKGEAAFEYDYFQVPEVSTGMLSHSVEVRFEASWSSTNYGSWAAAKPELLLLKGDHGSQPTAGNYTYKAMLEEQNKTYHLDLCPSQLKEGVWRAAMYNPMRIYQIAYNLTATKQGHCLNDCSGHGECGDDGICSCAANWSGGDCSVDPSGTCLQGSRRPVGRPDQKGTCWQECSCDGSGNCQFQESCADFTCDSASLRRKGSQAECVEDQCTQGVWEETEAHSCLKECDCPADGSACQFTGACQKANFACKNGYKRSSKGVAECYPVKSSGGGGSPAWAVLLWVLFSLVVGAAAGVGLLWWNERRLRTSNGQNDSLYHELSMDTGF